MSAAAKRTRRSPQQQIDDLEAKITKIRERAEQAKARKDPSLRHIAAALRSIDKALGVTEDPTTRKALDEARSTIGACHSLNQLAPKEGGRGRRRSSTSLSHAPIDPEKVQKFVAAHPGSRCEEIAASVGVDTRAVSPVLKALKVEGLVRSEGQARGMKYYAG